MYLELRDIKPQGFTMQSCVTFSIYLYRIYIVILKMASPTNFT